MIRLTNEQKNFINEALKGSNVLVDACIGSGKTTSIQQLCNKMPKDTKILYLTYNRLLKIDAQSKIHAPNATVTNYHGFAYGMLMKMHVKPGISDIIQTFNDYLPAIPRYNVLIIDEYQDIEVELAEMLYHIKDSCPGIQIIAVGDMDQKIYDKTTLDVRSFIENFLEDHTKLTFTRCFRLNKEHAGAIGKAWGKLIHGSNRHMSVEILNTEKVLDILAEEAPENILCLGARTGKLPFILNELERRYPEKFNKKTVYASIRENDSYNGVAPTDKTAIFTTFDSSKGLERKVCIICNFDNAYWTVRAGKPGQKTNILRNIFCVAASRGKKRIIFVHDPKDRDFPINVENLRLEEDQYKPIDGNLNISEMFEFKYKEDIEDCYDMLTVRDIPTEDRSIIKIKNHDGMIDLSPCIGMYQEAVYFDKHSMEREYDLFKTTHRDQVIEKYNENESLEKQILCLVSAETKQRRYVDQVAPNFVTKEQKQQIIDRLGTVLRRDEEEQVGCRINVFENRGSLLAFSMVGYADVIKDNTVYELKFVSEITHEHILQCACYMAAKGLKQGIVWNIYDNHMVMVTMKDRDAFIRQVVIAVSKGEIKDCTVEYLDDIMTPETRGKDKQRKARREIRKKDRENIHRYPRVGQQV